MKMTRVSGTAVLLLSALIVLASAMTARPAVAASAYCPNPGPSRPAKVPPRLAPAVAAAFNIDKDAAPNTAFVRCVGARLMGCYVGANLDCDKANTRRMLPGATAWCRQNPGAMNIPMAATGHDTIYAWRCVGKRAVAGRAIRAVDPDGYDAGNWKEVAR
jgi:hypothetical protein